jgi:hypothetical protein
MSQFGGSDRAAASSQEESGRFHPISFEFKSPRTTFQDCRQAMHGEISTQIKIPA